MSHHQQNPLHWFTVQRTVPTPLTCQPTPHGWNERRETRSDDARAREFKTKNFNSRFLITTKSFKKAYSRKGRSEKKWPPSSFARLCAHEIDIATCGAWDTNLLTGLSAFANHYATDLKISKIHMHPLVCKINVLSGVHLPVDEGCWAMFSRVASEQSASPGSSEGRRVSAKVPEAGFCRDSSVALPCRVGRSTPDLGWSSCSLHLDVVASVFFHDAAAKSHHRF